MKNFFKSIRKFVCLKLKTYKRNRYRTGLPLPITQDSGSTNVVTYKNVKRIKGQVKEIKSKNARSKSGDYTRNPFFNYLREYRRSHCGMTIIEQAVQAGAEWRSMGEKEKCKYVVCSDGRPGRRRRYKRRSIYWIKRKEIGL